MTKKDPSRIDQLLDLLLDALQERQVERGVEPTALQPPQAVEGPAKQIAEPSVIQPPQEEERPASDVPEPTPAQPPPVSQEEPADADTVAGPEIDVTEEGELAEPDAPEKLPPIHLDRMLGRLAVFLLLLIVLVNIPYNRYGTNLARAMPDVKALVIRDGLVLKGEGEEIYVLENNHKRWISSLEAFEFYGYSWEQVNQVDDDFLEQFPTGPPLSLVYKCEGSPHIYTIENGVKRWIKDIPTFEAQGYVWEDVQFVPCQTIDAIPSGPPIPPDAGEPPGT